MLCTSKITTCENVFKEPNEIKLNKKLPRREEIKENEGTDVGQEGGKDW